MSFTYEGEPSLAFEWLPFARSQQAAMKRNGSMGGNIKPNADVLLMIRTNPDHIHIIVGDTEFDYFVFYGNLLMDDSRLNTDLYYPNHGAGHMISIDTSSLDDKKPVARSHYYTYQEDSETALTGDFAGFFTASRYTSPSPIASPAVFPALSYRNKNATLGAYYLGVFSEWQSEFAFKRSPDFFHANASSVLKEPDSPTLNFAPYSIDSTVKFDGFYLAVSAASRKVFTYTLNDHGTDATVISEADLAEPPEWFVTVASDDTVSPADILNHGKYRFNRNGTKLGHLRMWNKTRYEDTPQYAYLYAQSSLFEEYDVDVSVEGVVSISLSRQEDQANWVDFDYNGETSTNELVHAWIRVAGEGSYYHADQDPDNTGLTLPDDNDWLYTPITKNAYLEDSTGGDDITGVRETVVYRWAHLRVDTIVESDIYGRLLTVRGADTDSSINTPIDPNDGESDARGRGLSGKHYSTIVDMDLKYRAVLVHQVSTRWNEIQNDQERVRFTAFGQSVETRHNSGGTFPEFMPTYVDKDESFVKTGLHDITMKAGDLGVSETQFRYTNYYGGAGYNGYDTQYMMIGRDETLGYIKCHPDINKKTFAVFNSVSGHSRLDTVTYADRSKYPYVDEFWGIPETEDSTGVFGKLRAYSKAFSEDVEGVDISVRDEVLSDVTHRSIYNSMYYGQYYPPVQHIGFAEDKEVDGYFSELGDTRHLDAPALALNGDWLTNKKLEIEYNDAAYAASINADLEI